MLTSATNPWVSGEHTHTHTPKMMTCCQSYRMRRDEGITGHHSTSNKRQEIIKVLTCVLTHWSRGFTAWKHLLEVALGRLSSRACRADRFMTPVFSHSLRGQERLGRPRDGFCLAFSFATTQCRSAPTESQGFLNHGKHQSNRPSHIMSAAKGAAVCLLCVYMQKAYRILGGSDCCSCQ